MQRKMFCDLKDDTYLTKGLWRALDGTLPVIRSENHDCQS